MTNVIKPRRTPTAAKVPTTADLADGELGVNTTDKKIYVRVGAAIVEVANVVAGGGGGGGITWTTVAANTAMTAGNAYIVTGAWDMTIPATAAASSEFIVHAMNAVVTIVSNGNVITGVGSGNNLTIVAGETAHLVASSASNLEIV